MEEEAAVFDLVLLTTIDEKHVSAPHPLVYLWDLVFWLLRLDHERLSLEVLVFVTFVQGSYVLVQVIQNLSNMYYEDHIYCYIGNVVISVNPFKDLPIYDDVRCQL